MASKSKKRRRVLGASCILAALIIAGSSFAWFTSKDEVTNRLTASADYGVSIIENFAPPKQWTPGQTVTKEEAVTNTGSVDAFVKQKITADLEVTTEVPTTDVPGTAGRVYIELKDNEYGSIEAGSYVAWSPVAADIGRKVVYVMDTSAELSPNGHALPVATDFNPTTEGLYIFRRAITTAKTDDDPVTGQSTLNDTAYEYVGYYYKDGKYYKINRIIPSTLELAENGDGALAKAPTVMYSTTATETVKPVAMKYVADAADPRLEVEYQSARRGTAALATANTNAYNAYNKYLNDNIGKTTWDNEGDKANAYDDTKTTGLTNRDAYDSEDTAVVPLPNLSNYSLARLNDLVDIRKEELDTVSPTTTAPEYNDANWETVYNEAVDERKTVNKGVKSAERLDTLKTTLQGKIGTYDGTTTPVTPGLEQDSAYPFYYSASIGDSSSIVAPTVTLTNPHTPYMVGDPSGTNHSLTLDNMRRDEFSDNYVKTGTAGWYVFNTTNNYGAPFNYDTTTDNDLRNKWDAYVLAKKRQVLNQAKIDEVEAALADNNYDTNGANTDIGRTKPELQEYLLVLTAEKNDIAAALKYAKEDYEKYVNDNILEDIATLNKYQDDVNAANKVSANAAGKYGASDSDASTFPTDKSTVFADTNQGDYDTGKEEALKNFLTAVYGFAVKDDATHNDTSEYTGDPDSPASATDLYKDIYTYSPANTKATFEDNIKSEDGVITWKTPEYGWGTIGASATATMPAQGDVDNTPYYLWRKAQMMQEKRQNDVAADLADYNNKKYAFGAVLDTDEDLDPIKIIVHLANIGDGTAADKWQYIEGAAGDADKEFNFFYTSILESGETSKLLIKSVEMDKNVTQDMFRDLQFDLNVSSESAQAIYEDGLALPTSANQSLSGGKTTKATGYAETEAVQWEKKTDPATPSITDKDPQGKATANVTP